jgi:cyclopropane fatty-acyl-phospholipid synthase-like methyltransferase
VTEARVARAYDRWLSGWSISGKLYSLLTTVPGMILVNTPAFRLDKELVLKPGQRLLDVGCGRGSMLQVLAARAHLEVTPVGVDLSRAMLRAGRRARGAATSPELLRAPASDLPLANESIDIGLSAHMIKHLNDYELHRFFQELWRVLKPGGYAVLWEFAPAKSSWRNRVNEWMLTQGVKDYHLRDLEEVIHLAAAAGFEWANSADLRPFLFPPIPRVSVIVGKAPPGWQPDQPQPL